MSVNLKTFVFNAFQVNTYLIYDEDGNCIIVDPACYDEYEQNQLKEFITQNNLKPKYLINTHCHIDHILGNPFVYHEYGLKPMIHKAGLPFLDGAQEYASGFGFDVNEIIEPDTFLEDEAVIKLNETDLIIKYTPGHADGSVCIVNEKQKWIITGDLLFYGSIGRTDLPSGSLETLLRSIREKIFIYDDEYMIFPGHGRETVIGFEKKHNPYL